MGIQGLGRFLSEMAPECIRQQVSYIARIYLNYVKN
jgi:hypothetical protein